MNTLWARLRARLETSHQRRTRTYNATHGAITTLGITPEKASRLYDVPIELLGGPATTRPYRDRELDD